jgi:hypothetical protein
MSGSRSRPGRRRATQARRGLGIRRGPRRGGPFGGFFRNNLRAQHYQLLSTLGTRVRFSRSCSLEKAPTTKKKGMQHAAGVSSPEAQRRGGRTTDIFCRKNGKCCTIKYYIRKIQNPWILGKHEIQYFTVLYFPFFRQKLSVVLNFTPRFCSALAPLGCQVREETLVPRVPLGLWVLLVYWASASGLETP